ncbi:hypothetical protein ACFWY9_40585 [Amycolatopsis sp. NPDC059027]|uniref:hypothetical protein n=1 Tax=unclassified Amycolatopsis TaxID=2618356 RepID=UPI00366DBD47
MRIQCTIGRAVRTMALAFAAGAVLGGIAAGCAEQELGRTVHAAGYQESSRGSIIGGISVDAVPAR